jgi:hypothetical protein
VGDEVKVPTRNYDVWRTVMITASLVGLKLCHDPSATVRESPGPSVGMTVSGGAPAGRNIGLGGSDVYHCWIEGKEAAW